MIGRHQLIVLQFYPFLLRYLQSHEKDKIGEIFAMIIESCHELVPPEEVKPIIEKIISNFITDYCNNLHITIGLNSIREILLRMPLALDESQIEYLVGFRVFKNSSVVAAAKSLINYFRDVCPNLLPKKFRGRFTKLDEDNRKEDMIYGKQKISYGIDGIELLERAEGIESGNLMTTRILTDADLRKIRLLKLKNAVKGITHEKLEGEAESEKDEEDEESLEDDEEEGEEDMSDDEEGEDGEEGEDEMSEGDDEEEGEEDVSEKAESEKSDSFQDVNSGDEELSSEEEGNPHGFVYSNQLDTFKRSKRERIAASKLESEATKDAHRAQFKRRDKKGGGESNKVKVKNKPFNMVKQKKLDTIHDRFTTTKSKLKSLKVQLGKYKKTQKSKIESRKKRFKQK